MSAGQRWAGRILTGVAVLFMIVDGATKVAKVPPVVEATLQMGFPESAVQAIGVLALVGTALYVVPRTSVLGAIFLTGFLGGAVAANVRMSTPLFSHTLFPTYMAAMLWGGLLLRRPGLLALLVGPLSPAPAPSSDPVEVAGGQVAGAQGLARPPWRGGGEPG